MRIGYARISTRSQQGTAQLDAMTEAGVRADFRDVSSARLLFHLLGAIDEFTADLDLEGTHKDLAAARPPAVAAAAARRSSRPPTSL